MHEVFLSRLEGHGDDIALNELGHLVADHVRPEKLAGLRVEDGLNQPFRLAERNGLAVADEGEPADFNLISGFPSPGLGEADAGEVCGNSCWVARSRRAGVAKRLW